MKKFVTLFTDSARELKSVRTITTMAMLAAVAVILGYFSIEYGQFIRIGFSGIPNGIVDYLFGPVAGAVFHGALDIIKYLMKPTGPFCPQLTLVVMLAGVLYGCFFYKKKAYHMESACCEVCSNAHLQCHSQYSVSAGTVWTGIDGNPSNACTEEPYYVADRFNCLFRHCKGIGADWTVPHLP